MKGLIKQGTIALLGLMSIILLGLAIAYPQNQSVLYQMITHNVVYIVTTIIIIGYLLVKAYYELTKIQSGLASSARVMVILLYALMFIVNLFVTNPTVNVVSIKGAVVFRMLTLSGALYAVEYFISNKVDVRKYLILGVVNLIMIVATIIFNISELLVISSLYYFIVLSYLLIVMYNAPKDTNWSSVTGAWIVMIGLLNDFMILTIDLESYELLYIALSAAVILVYTYRLVNRYKEHDQLVDHIDIIERENKRLKIEQNRTLKSVDLLKNDLSFKFKRKQNYFENLEMALEVLNSSLVVINQDFKVELAQGQILENSTQDDLTGLDVSKALFTVSDDEGQYFKSVVTKIFDAPDDVRENLFISLLDEHLIIDNIMYSMNYHVMHKRDQSKILVMEADSFSDQSDQNLQLIREKEISDMVIMISRNSESFFADLTSYINFTKSVLDLIDNDRSVNDNIFRVLRRVHTYKGVFDQYHMTTVITALNDVETELLNMMHNMSDLTLDQLKRLIQGYDLRSLLTADLSLIEDRLGHQFLENNKRVSIDVTAYDRIRIKLNDTIEDKELLEEIEKLTYIDVKERLSSYVHYVKRLAFEQSKMVKFVVRGDVVTVDRDAHIDLFEGLIHILKNCIHHGIEYPDERRRKNKREHGIISCNVQASDGGYQIKISDDGKGINLKEIKNRLFILGKYTIDQLDELDDDFLYNIVMEDGVTSSNMPNSLSGRSVGMGSIKEIVENLNGSVHVSSKKDEGVSYVIDLPYQDMISQPTINYEALQKNLSLQVERILTKSEKKDTLSSTWQCGEMMIAENNLYDLTASTYVQGYKDTRIVVSIDEKLVYHIVNTYGLHMKYKGSNIKVMNEAISIFVEDIAKRMVDALKGVRYVVNVKSAVVVSTTNIKQNILNRTAYYGQIDINEGKLMVMVFKDY